LENGVRFKAVERLRKSEKGFTLIELLVVVIIIGIIAAIAIPVFLSQRQRGWRAAVQSDLRNAAVGAETYLTDHGEYTDLPDPTGLSPDVSIDVKVADAESYCLEGVNSKHADEIWSIRSDGGLAQVACADPVPTTTAAGG
jgi:type IV pilus assembly protein PilA